MMLCERYEPRSYGHYDTEVCDACGTRIPAGASYIELACAHSGHRVYCSRQCEQAGRPADHVCFFDLERSELPGLT